MSTVKKSSLMIDNQRRFQSRNLPKQEDIWVIKKNLMWWRLPLYAICLVDFLTTLMLIFTIFRWNSFDFEIPTAYLLLYLFHVPHLFTSAAVVAAIIYGSINRYFLNITCILIGFAATGDFIVIIWRGICLANPGSSIACPILPTGLWLAWAVEASEIVLFVAMVIGFLCIVMYTRGMIVNIDEYYNVARKLQTETTNDTAKVSFQQPQDVFQARIRLRQLVAFDFFLLIGQVILRLLFFYSVGFWWAPFLATPHIFLWLWNMELAGSDEWKVPVYMGGTDASTSDELALITQYFYSYLMFGDTALFVLLMFDLVNFYFSYGVLENVMAVLVALSVVGLFIYDVIVYFRLNVLVNWLGKYRSAKIH